MDDSQLRLEILKLVIPVATRYDINDPARTVEVAKLFEKYVKGTRRGNQSNKS